MAAVTERDAQRSRAARSRSVVATILMLLAAVGIAPPVAIELTPAQETTVAGQYVGVGATSPTGGWLGDLGEVFDSGPSTWPRAASDGFEGPAELQQIGKTTVDLDRVQVRGPLRPKLELGPLVRTREADDLLDPEEGPAARARALDSITEAFRTWYLWATLLLLLVTTAIVAVATTTRLWLGMRRASRHTHRTIGDVWHAHARRLRRDGLLALAAALVAWLAAGALAWQDTRAGLAGVSSARDLVGADPVHVRPAGPTSSGYEGAVIGDSRASRLGGPLLADPDESEAACGRSTDSLAAQLTRLSASADVLNLACPSATIADGLLGAQWRRGTILLPQVSRLLKMPDLRFVVVMVGPNDLAWADFLRYCYAVDECDDRFTSDQFDYRLAGFDRDYGDLLAALASLPTQPEVIIVGSYEVFDLDADCAETEAPGGRPGLSADNLALLADRNDRLNEVLVAGADAYGFTTVIPQLATLCQPADPEVGRDLQGLEDPHPFHPTGVGMVRLAATIFTAVSPLEPAP